MPTGLETPSLRSGLAPLSVVGGVERAGAKADPERLQCCLRKQGRGGRPDPRPVGEETWASHTGHNVRMSVRDDPRPLLSPACSPLGSLAKTDPKRLQCRLRKQGRGGGYNPRVKGG